MKVTKTDADPDQFAQKMRVPADIVHIMFPVLCWALLAFRWNDLWLTKQWMAVVIVAYYALAVTYLIFILFVRMRVIAIVGLFLLLAASLFMWIPYNWVLAVLLVPALFWVFYKRGSKTAAIVLAATTGAITLLIILFCGSFLGLIPEKFTYYTSLDGRYVALEYAFTQIPSGTDVFLCHEKGPLLVKERILYLANYSDYGGSIEWLDESTILIYGEKMDVFNDPTIYNYTAF
jgi:hypothetical protein